MRYCRRERRDWWKLLINRHSYVVINWIKSELQAQKDEREASQLTDYEAVQRVQSMGYIVSDPRTGDVLEMEGKNNDSQD